MNTLTVMHVNDPDPILHNNCNNYNCLMLVALPYIMDDLYIPFLSLLRTASVTIKMKQRAMAITTAIASTAYMARIAIASGLLCVPAC